MSTFHYKAVRQTGEIVEGDLEAVDRERALAGLAEMGCVPIKVDLGSGASVSNLLSMDVFGGGSGRIAQRDIMIVTREIATLLDAGVELERALGIIVDLAERPALRDLFRDILEEVRGGSALSDALEKRADKFPRSYVGMVRAGESGGTLAVVMDRIAVFLESSHAARENLRSALIYPILLLVMAVIAVGVMVSVVIPQFEPLFAGAGKELPLLTRLMLSASDGVERYGLIVLGLGAVGVVWFRQRLRKPATRLLWHRRMLSAPLMGGLLLKSDIGSFARTLGALLRNGVSTLAAFAIVRETVSNAYLAEEFGQAAERIQSGTTISDALVSIPHFPALAAHLVRVGEETGRLEDMLDRMAQIYEDDTRRAVQRMLAILLPGLTALMGLFIAAIIASIFLAIVSVNQLAF
ncbi:MAG: general secretion pathway protein F [Alphaproteobacteria bacterium]|jgi:general secretion pathway protein F